jgi:hypothetical protein
VAHGELGRALADGRARGAIVGAGGKRRMLLVLARAGDGFDLAAAPLEAPGEAPPALARPTVAACAAALAGLPSGGTCHAGAPEAPKVP